MLKFVDEVTDYSFNVSSGPLTPTTTLLQRIRKTRTRVHRQGSSFRCDGVSRFCLHVSLHSIQKGIHLVSVLFHIEMLDGVC